MIDLQAVRTRAAARLAIASAAEPASVANAAKWLTETGSERAAISHFATLATHVERAETLSSALHAPMAGRLARLLRWGWPEAAAQALADRLALRDREADPRVSCVECRHYGPDRCGNHRRAGLGGDEVGRDLAGLLQRCDGFVSWRDWR